MTSVSADAAIEILQICAGQLSVCRKQSHGVANRTQRGIDCVREQMNFHRLTLTGDDQNLATIGHQIFRAFGNPSLGSRPAGTRDRRIGNLSQNCRGNLSRPNSPARAADGPHSRR